MLEGEDVTDTAVDRVTKTRLCLITYSDGGIKALVGRGLIKDLGNIAGTEHLVHRGEVLHPLL